MSKKRIWYKYEFHHGPGHQSHITEYMSADHELNGDEQETIVDRLAWEHDLENWTVTPEIVSEPPEWFVRKRIRVALTRIEDGVDELRLHKAVSKAWSKFPGEMRQRLAKLIDMHLARLKSITHEHTETFTYAQVREWARSACVLYMMDFHGGVE